jgi:phosphomannomutase
MQISFASWNEGGKIVEYKAALNDHLDAVLSLPYININTIKSKKYKVCLDTINGAGGVIMKQLLDRLGCTVVALNGDQTGIFNHEPEPLPENLGQLCEAIREHKADFGA